MTDTTETTPEITEAQWITSGVLWREVAQRRQEVGEITTGSALIGRLYLALHHVEQNLEHYHDEDGPLRCAVALFTAAADALQALEDTGGIAVLRVAADAAHEAEATEEQR